MATTTDVGREGEKLAVAYLQTAGHHLLYRNWRYKQFELDIITEHNGLLHFTEVKFRGSNSFGPPEDAVNKKKIQSLLKAIDQFLFMHPKYDNFHLDILSINQKNNDEPEYFLIEDVYL